MASKTDTKSQAMAHADEVVNLETVASRIKNGQITRVVVLTGAGISTAAGIPDFRSPNTGLYDRLAPLNLPYPEAIFHISYFSHTPEPLCDRTSSPSRKPQASYISYISCTPSGEKFTPFCFHSKHRWP